MSNHLPKLRAALKELSATVYNRHYFATNSDGEPCRPDSEEVATLSLRGALMRVAQGDEYTILMEWLTYHRLIPVHDPRTKAIAISKLIQAIEKATEKAA